MKICYQCLLDKSIKIEQPQMLISYRGCDFCRKQVVSSWNWEEVKIQNKVLK